MYPYTFNDPTPDLRLRIKYVLLYAYGFAAANQYEPC